MDGAIQHLDGRGSFSEIPHVFTTTYRSLWDGVGSDVLSLRGLRPGGTTDANTTQATMLLAISSASAGDLELARKRSRTRLDLTLPANWKAFASYGHGAGRAAAPLARSSAAVRVAATSSVPESIAYDTTDVLAGCSSPTPLTNVNLARRGVFFPESTSTR